MLEIKKTGTRIIFTGYARNQKDWNQNNLLQVCSKSKRLEPISSIPGEDYSGSSLFDFEHTW
jgi:hypothetical protein